MRRPIEQDHELAALLICLAPLGERGLRYVDVERREFDWHDMLDSQGWSTGEGHLIRAAGNLWQGYGVEGVDLSYLAFLDRAWFEAVMNAIAAYRRQDVTTDWRAALAAVVQPA